MMVGQVREDFMMEREVFKDYMMIGKVREDYMKEREVCKD